MKLKTSYRTTDLQLEATVDLTPLADALVKKGLFNFHVHQWEDGVWTARLTATRGFNSPDRNIGRILKSIESLNKASRILWDACTLRDFDIAFDCGEEPTQFTERISPSTIQRISQVGGGIVITLYPEKPDEYYGSCNLPPS